MIRVHICDDHKLVAEGIELMLKDESDIQFAGATHSAEDLIALSNGEKDFCNVLLLDINLPKMNGIEACKTLKANVPKVNVIALSMLKELSLVKLMLKSGANGYLVKNAGKDEIMAAIRSVASGKKYIDDDLKDLLLEDFTSGKSKKDHEIFPSLSRREKEVLNLILQEFTAVEIAEKLFISNGTVETHRRNMLSKLGVRNTAGLVRMAMEYNLLEK